VAEPTLSELVTATNILWTLVTGFLVMFMQAGFALLETGLCRKKNAAHIMAMNFLVYSIGILGFWVMGFAFQMGGVGALSTFGGDATLSHEFALEIGGKSFGLFGTQGFFLTFANYTPAVAALFLFQMVFMDTAATIPTGAWPSAGSFCPSCCSASRCRRSFIPSMPIGCGAAAGSLAWAQTTVSATVTSISPAARWCT
jgi:ammonia channel protein AmtB